MVGNTDDLEQERAKSRRQHVAEIYALRALCLAEIQGIELDAARLGSITAVALASAPPEERELYEDMPWDEFIAVLAKELWRFVEQNFPHTTCVPTPRYLLQ